MTRKSNPFGKSISAEAVRNGTAEPYATYRAGALTWKVLKTWQRPDKEKDNQHARWFVLGESPAAGSYGDLGDMYAAQVREHGILVQATDEWREHYGEPWPFTQPS